MVQRAEKAADGQQSTGTSGAGNAGTKSTPAAAEARVREPGATQASVGSGKVAASAKPQATADAKLEEKPEATEAVPGSKLKDKVGAESVRPEKKLSVTETVTGVKPPDTALAEGAKAQSKPEKKAPPRPESAIPSAESRRPAAPSGALGMFGALAAADTPAKAKEGLREFLKAEPLAGHRRYYYEAILRRNPSTDERPLEVAKNRLDFATTFMESHEFAFTHIDRFFEMFPHLKRFLILHVRKCGGSTVNEGVNRSPQFSALNSGEILVKNYVGPRFTYYFHMMKSLTREEVKFITVQGHVPASYIFSRKWKRENDKVYCLVRDPVEIIVSYINFVLTGIFNQSDDSSSLQRSERLGISGRKFSRREEMIELVPAVLEHEILKEPPLFNPICQMVGMTPDFKSAVDMAGSLDITFVDTRSTTKFMEMNDIVLPGKYNESIKFVDFRDLRREDAFTVMDLVGEDLKLWDLYQRGTSLKRI